MVGRGAPGCPNTTQEWREQLVKHYGAGAVHTQHLEAFEITEYGR
jgi:hypothetical protein